MRDLYLAYSNNKKLQPLVAEIAWSHNLAILSRCKDDLEREFYLRMPKKFGWSKVVPSTTESELMVPTRSTRLIFSRIYTAKVLGIRIQC